MLPQDGDFLKVPETVKRPVFGTGNVNVKRASRCEGHQTNVDPPSTAFENSIRMRPSVAWAASSNVSPSKERTAVPAP